MDGVCLQLHYPPREDMGLHFNDPWDRDASGYATIIKEGDLLWMYYRGGPADKSSGAAKAATAYFCYAESRNGINLVKPKLGLVEFQ